MDTPKNSSHENDPYDIDIQACSATDCTGLIPALPQDEAEMEAYEDIYPYLTEASSRHKTPKTSPPAGKM